MGDRPMIDRILADLEAINQELQSRGIMFHNDRIRNIRKYLRHQDQTINTLQKDSTIHSEKILSKTREILDRDVTIGELRETIRTITGIHMKAIR
jgi:hypothetical protein